MHEVSWSSLLPLANGPLFQEMKSTFARLLAWTQKELVSQPCLSGSGGAVSRASPHFLQRGFALSSAFSALWTGTQVKPGGDMLIVLNVWNWRNGVLLGARPGI